MLLLSLLLLLLLCEVLLLISYLHTSVLLTSYFCTSVLGGRYLLTSYFKRRDAPPLADRPRTSQPPATHARAQESNTPFRAPCPSHSDPPRAKALAFVRSGSGLVLARLRSAVRTILFRLVLLLIRNAAHITTHANPQTTEP